MNIATDASFDRVLQAPFPTVVMLWQPGCPPCKALAPILADVERKLPSIGFAMINSEANPKTKQRYGVAACPALLVFRGGQMLGRWLGFAPEEKVMAWVQRTLGA